MTGTEPLASRLQEEPYLDRLVELITWATASTTSVILSCLAAHAAALCFEGIERSLLGAKCSGVFQHEIGPPHPLSAGLKAPVAMPHSRLNDVACEPLVKAGYSQIITSNEVSWSLLAKEHGGCLLVFVQGHPEYSTSSLLREYRRDLLRHLRGQGLDPPPLPVGYLDEESRAALARFNPCGRGQVENGTTGDDFPFEEIAARLTNSWQASGRRLYSNWLQYVIQRARPETELSPAAGRQSAGLGSGA